MDKLSCCQAKHACTRAPWHALVEFLSPFLPIRARPLALFASGSHKNPANLINPKPRFVDPYPYSLLCQAFSRSGSARKGEDDRQRGFKCGSCDEQQSSRTPQSQSFCERDNVQPCLHFQQTEITWQFHGLCSTDKLTIITTIAAFAKVWTFSSINFSKFMMYRHKVTNVTMFSIITIFVHLKSLFSRTCDTARTLYSCVRRFFHQRQVSQTSKFLISQKS